jgi:uncharacterized alkaline shock family protein YloU
VAEPSDADRGNRGTLVVKDRVAQRIAVRAARDTAGVLPQDARMTKLIGRELPKVTVMISADRVRAAVDVAVPWPCPLTDVGAAVRQNVGTALHRLAGLQVDGVDVTVSKVVSETEPTPARVLQ